MSYTSSTEDFIKKISNQEENDYGNKKQHIKDIISKEIEKHKSNLARVESCIEKKFHSSLSTIDRAYIERKYIKCCTKLWQQETTNYLKKLTENKNRTVIQEIFNSLDDIKSLNQIPNPFNQLEYYTLLIEHYELVWKENEKASITRFKKECLEQIVAYSDSAKNELVFLETFINFLNYSINLKSIIGELKLEDFCHGSLSFGGLINNIMKLEVGASSKNVIILQEVSEVLKKEGLFLIDKFKEVLGAYIKPVEIQERKTEGRVVVEVTGKNIVTSNILDQLHYKLSKNSNIEEIRFIGADIIHININLKSEVWQGKNIVILAKTMKVHNTVIWDVSGKDNDHIYSSNAGIRKDGHGKQGKDGYPGESGGNVLILVEKMEDPKNFTIISNGGKGSKGQDGGKGEDGEDGKGITEQKIIEMFPSPVNLYITEMLIPPVSTLLINLDQHEKLKAIIKNIENNSSTVEIVWYNGNTSATFNKINSQSINFLDLYDSNTFIKTVTSQGNEITFSYEKGGFRTQRQAFFLYKGSLGKPGKDGGEYGLGGQGGYSGEIVVKNLVNSSHKFNIIKNTIQGEEGGKGQGGLYGNHGKNGWDMGYLDFKWWKKAMFLDRGKYKIEYYDNTADNRIWCPYKKKYAEIITVNNEQKKQKRYEERKIIRQNNDRQHHAQAIRKKNIPKSSILASYSHHFDSVEKNILQKLEAGLENTKQQALQAIIEIRKQQEKQTTELKIKRHFPYQNKSKHHNDIFIMTSSTTYKETIDVKRFLKEVKKKPLLLNNWFRVKNIELSFSQLDRLFLNFEILKSRYSETQPLQDNMENSRVQDIEKFLIDKYRLATLQKIAKQLLTYQEVADNPELTPESAAKFLVESKENDCNTSHVILGTLNQYFNDDNKEQRKKITEYGNDELQNTENEALKHSITAFVLEVGKLEEAHTDVIKYYNEHKEFLKKQEHSLAILFEAFKSELYQPRHAEIFHSWTESIEDKSLISKLEEKIQKDVFLKVLYNRLNNQLEQEYNWNECCKDQAIIKKWIAHIQEKGLLSGSYKELLAFIFDINIRLYAENQDNKLFLQYNHNPSSKQIIHILLRNNKVVQLKIDKNYLHLEEERKKKDNLYANILTEIKTFKHKQEFDDYLKNKGFLSNNSPSEYEQSFNEEEDIEKIIKYFPDRERQQIKERLKKITPQYIGQQEIVQNILKRFSSEGRHVSSHELCCFINSILDSVIESRKMQNIFCWIIAAHSQRNWINELILLRLENYFKKPLAEKFIWREYLSKIKNKDILLLFEVKLYQHGSSSTISTQCIEDTLHLLSNIPNETVSLEGLELYEWPYALKEKYWTCMLSKLVDWQKHDLPAASYYLLSTENIFGTDLVKKFLEALKKKKQDLSPDALTYILSYFHNEKWSLSEDELNTLNSCNFHEWLHKMHQKFTAYKEDRKIMQLVELIKGNTNISEEISGNLSKIVDSIQSVNEKGYIIHLKSVNSFTTENIKKWIQASERNINEGRHSIEETYKEMLAVIDRAIELKRGFKLRDTQKLTVLVLLTNDCSTLAQVSTGEGKSLIVVAASIMRALCGEKVDIITSSSVLAKRDAEGNKDIYNLFGINVSHNCSEDIEKRKEAYSSNQVIYGDLSNFQRDYLLDKFYGKNILGDRNFDNVIIDEVDSMLLDQGNNMLYLSHDMAGFDKLESVYIYIWQWINRPARDHKELSYSFDTKAIKEAVLNNLYGLIKKEDIEKLGPELSSQHKNIIWERLIKADVLDYQGKLLKENIDSNKLKEVILPEFSGYEDRLNYLLKECIEREKFIHVPNYLKSFVEQHLESWINSAVIAFFMKTGQDYVVDVDRTGTSPNRNLNITILDRDTGTDQANSQWDEALHQFLQLKHGCKLSLQTLKAVFISNVSFFKLYRNLYGLTGTLGSQRERDLLREIHKVAFVIIPTAKSKKFHEDKPILCTSTSEWIKCINNEARKQIEEKKRSVLIICETVNDVETLYNSFGGKNAKFAHTYTRDYEELDKGFEIVKDNKELGQKQIIIATNLAGRGTDIKITEGLRKAGGLHICLTYLPKNTRVEQQAFGRAARNGDQGSGQLIILDSKGKEYNNSKILSLKKERDAKELCHVFDIKTYYETQISMEESYFKTFKERYEQLKKGLDGNEVPAEVKEILLQCCLDEWAFWLDINSKCIKNVIDEQSKRNLDSLLGKFILLLNDLTKGNRKSWLAWVEGNPVQMIKLGKYLSQKKEHENAIELFNEVIKEEPYFSEAAHYYKAFALAKKIDWERQSLNEKLIQEFEKALNTAARLLEEHSKFSNSAASIIDKIKKNNSESIIHIDAYEKQQKSFANLCYIFSQSIEDILGHFITPHYFINNVIKEELAEVLYEDLLTKGILLKPRLKKNISEEELKTIHLGYGISFKMLQDFLSKYEGRYINEQEFQKELKKEIQLPSRNVFWKLLIEQNVLSKEVKYVKINNEKLREIDPSLLVFLIEKVNKEELKKQTLMPDNKQFFFYVEKNEEIKDDYVFEKNDFINAVGRNKYQVLKEKKILSFNKQAYIDRSEIKSTDFSCYDSITLEDFSKVNITSSEAKKILANLVEQKVLEKKDAPENSAYGLKIKFDKIEQIQLLPCPVYENAVKGLLSHCFNYRIALQKIERQLEEENFPICLQLSIKPHQDLIFELLEQKIIRPPMVETEIEDLEKKIKNMYSQTMNEDNFKLMLSRNKLIPEECIDKLFDCLVEKGWIAKQNLIQSLAQDLYYINLPDKRQILLNFSHELSQKNEMIKLQNIDETVKKILYNQLQLTNENTITSIVSTLKRSRSFLIAFKIPDFKLKSFTEFCSQDEFENIEEMHIFSLNGLDHLLQLEEKKWTRNMLFNTPIVITMGLSQLAIGIVIELYSVGIMTHVGGAFVNEGVNDLFFALGALKSGHFSWGDYRKHKLNSLKYAVLTFGVGAYLSRGAKVSRFGYKLAGPNFQFAGKKAAEIAGTQLIKTAGIRVIGKELTKRSILKITERIAFDLINVGVDTLIENWLQELCDSISADILSSVEQKFEKHYISPNLEKIYTTLGEKKARKVVNNLTDCVFTERNCLEKYLPIVSKIANSVIQEIAEAVEKRSKTDNKLELSIHTISNIVTWSERALYIGQIPLITNIFMNNLDRQIYDKLSEYDNNKQDLPTQKQNAEEDYNIFKKEMIDQWTLLLQKKLGQLISQHIVSPILTKCANCLVKYVGKKIGETYQSYKESGYFESFEKLKQEYKEKLQNEQPCNNSSEVENQIAEKYHSDLLKLMIKTKNPDLLGAIIQEKIPMDMTCASACPQIIREVFKKRGVIVPGLKIIIEGDGGIRQEFPCSSEEIERIIIPIQLKDNHFEFCASSTSENNKSSESNNNCLYEALSEAIPELRDIITPEEFRTEVANCVAQDKKIRYHIQQGWHQLPVTLGAFGGARTRSGLRHDCESSSCDNEGLPPSKDHIYRVHDVSKHIVDRFQRFLRFGGFIQNVSEKLNVDRDEVVSIGKSIHQDKSSTMGSTIHASHIIRAGEINSEIKKDPVFYDMFVNYLGHTQNVPRYANEWHGLGGVIDRYQSKKQNILSKIDFSRSLTTEDANTIKILKKDYKAQLNERIDTGKCRKTEKSDIEAAIKKLTSTSIESLFNKGKQGYSGKGMYAYK